MGNTRAFIMKRQHWYLIAYDIRQPKRLSRLQRWIKGQTFALQESVYLFVGNPQQWQTFKQSLEKKIKKTEDDVRVYQFSANSELAFYGNTPWPNGVHFSGYPPHQLYFQCIPCYPSLQIE
jgi:CRISPR-associated protein Cas2